MNSIDFKSLNNNYAKYEDCEGSNKLLVVFSYYDQPLNVLSHYRFLANTKCKKLFFHSGKNDWFQNGIPGICDSFLELINLGHQINKYFLGHELLFLGHSMGAFAALGIGVKSNASRILASVPEYKLMQKGSRSSRVLKSENITFLDLSEILSNNKNTEIIIINGNKDNFDCQSSKEIKNFPLVEVININSGHGTFPYLKNINKLNETLEGFVTGRRLNDVLANC